MSKRYRPWKIDEPMLLPAAVGDFVAKDHLARFVLNLVVEEFDLGEIERVYRVERGQPPYDPAMMTALLLYGYCNGVYSSRRIAKASRERVDFMSIVGLDVPDFRTISEFRKRHLKALAALFSQVLKLCERAGLVKLGHVALDGTKIRANASKHKAMSDARMAKRAEELEAEVASWLDAAAAADASEDAAFGRDRSGEEMPDWVADKKRRAEKIRAAKAELEAEARAAAEVERKARAEEEKKREAEGRKKPGRPAAPPSEAPDPKAQKNPRAATRGPHHEDQGRLHPRLQRAGGCGRRGAGDRRSRPRRQRDAGAECAVAAVAGVGQNDPHMWKSAKSALGLFLEDLNLVRSRLNAADEPSGPADREARISEAALHHTAVPQRS